MVSILQPATTSAWANLIRQSGQEFAPTPLPLLSGTIPPGLRGSLYRNGPATLERGGQRVGHWFDGDGGILGLHFGNGGATGVYRYVQSAGYQAEVEAGKFLFSNYGMVPPGQVWQRWGKPVKNAANTSVLALPDRLLALWEGGLPHALTLDTLETIGLDALNQLDNRPYSAHPKVDPHTGDIFNFGVSVGKTAKLHVYRSDRTGTIRQQGEVSLSGVPLIHDFVLAGRYLIFCVPPVRLEVLPVLLQLKSYSDALLWQPEKGTEIIVVDRESLAVVSRSSAAAWYQWHYGNGCELADGSVLLNLCRYEDFQTNQRLQEIATGQTQTSAIATLWQLRLDPQSGKVLDWQKVVDRSCEFPVVDPAAVGHPWRDTYLSLHAASADTTQDLFGAIARFDAQTGTLTETQMGANHYPSEPIYAADADHPHQGWILTVVYDGNTDGSQAWIYAADRLDDEPVCRLALPEVVPLGFHGTWKPA